MEHRLLLFLLDFDFERELFLDMERDIDSEDLLELDIFELFLSFLLF